MAVRREANGSTLYFIGPDGFPVQVTPGDPGYTAMLETEDLQINSKLTNKLEYNNYMTALANAQESVDVYRPAPAPTRPLMLVVSNPTIDDYGVITAGVQSSIPWMPPLPGLKPPPPVAGAPSTVKPTE